MARINVEAKDLKAGDKVHTNVFFQDEPLVVATVEPRAYDWLSVTYTDGSVQNLKTYWEEEIER